MKPRALSLVQVLTVYVLGVAAGAQVALYVYDRTDDGVADIKSGLIGLVFVVVGLAVVASLFRARERDN